MTETDLVTKIKCFKAIGEEHQADVPKHVGGAKDEEVCDARSRIAPVASGHRRWAGRRRIA